MKKNLAKKQEKFSVTLQFLHSSSINKDKPLFLILSMKHSPNHISLNHVNTLP